MRPETAKGPAMTLNLTIITGSTRPGRKGPLVADWVAGAASAHGGFAVTAVDLADLALPLLDEAGHPARDPYAHDHTRAWSALVKPADAFVFVTPEYDFFPPATLINALQVLFHEWRYKAAAVVSYGGISGGLRSGQQLRLLIANLGMMPIPQSVPVPMLANHLGPQGFTPNAEMTAGIGLMLGELAKWAGALKPLRG
jgi:NAD(P)H-dependent FMN reductase